MSEGFPALSALLQSVTSLVFLSVPLSILANTRFEPGTCANPLKDIALTGVLRSSVTSALILDGFLSLLEVIENVDTLFLPRPFLSGTPPANWLPRLLCC